MPDEISVFPESAAGEAVYKESEGAAAAEPREFFASRFSLRPASPALEKPAFHSFELGELFFRSGSFRKSLPYLEAALNHFLKEKDFDSYISCYSMLMFAYYEMGEKARLERLNLEFEENSAKFSLRKSARALGISACCLLFDCQKNYQSAFQKAKAALNMALDEHAEAVSAQDPLREMHAKIDVAYCLFVYIDCCYVIKDYKKCAAELANLKILLEHLFNLKKGLQLRDSKAETPREGALRRSMLKAIQKNFQFIQRIKLMVMSFETYIEASAEGGRLRKDRGEIEKILWQRYEEASKTGNDHILPYIFCELAYNCSLNGNLDQASVFVRLAEKSADPDRRVFFRCLEKCKKIISKAAKEKAEKYDMIVFMENRSVVERHKGAVSFNNQFILINLLKRLISSQGIPLSKQLLVEKIWGEEYSPAVHDNKIYVTIKRLRELVEPDMGQPRYICRNSGGYYLPETIRVLIK